MDASFETKRVGKVDLLSGVLQCVRCNIWGMKELDYAMRIMSTSGAFATDDTCRRTHHSMGPEHITFQCCKPFDWHFHYCNAVDDHNNLCHSFPSLEDTWKTQKWGIRVLTFLLAVMEVNMYLVLYFV